MTSSRPVSMAAWRKLLVCTSWIPSVHLWFSSDVADLLCPHTRVLVSQSGSGGASLRVGVVVRLSEWGWWCVSQSGGGGASLRVGVVVRLVTFQRAEAPNVSLEHSLSFSSSMSRDIEKYIFSF